MEITIHYFNVHHSYTGFVFKITSLDGINEILLVVESSICCRLIPWNTFFLTPDLKLNPETRQSSIQFLGL